MIKLNKEGKYHKWVRQFLCKGADSYCVTDINIEESTHYKTEKKSYSCWANLKLADCHRSVNLDFSSIEDMKKLDKLILQLLEFKEKLVEAHEFVKNKEKEVEND